jgi:SAM-dependent methyltransferase
MSRDVDRYHVFGETAEAVERIAPGFFPEGVEAEHVARYRWAAGAARIRGRSALDVACGTGYGSAMLCRAGARHVLGIDVSAAALDFARAAHAAPRYVRADALALPVREGGVDVVVSLETIEHLLDGKRFLVHLRTALRHGGVLLLSSPNVLLTGNANPYHVHEMSLDELTALLRATGFRLTGVWGQHWRLRARRGIWRLKGFGMLAFQISQWSRVWRLPGRLGFQPLYWCVRAVAVGPSSDAPQRLPAGAKSVSREPRERVSGGLVRARGLGASREILCLFLEFGRWHRARSWTYSAQLAYEEGLRANGARVSTVTTPWLPRLRELYGGRRFDQVWVEIVHQDVLGDDLLSWIAERAPVRVAFVPESLEYDAEAYAVWPQYRTRKAEVKHRLQFFTHALLVDEKDARESDAEGHVRAAWWPAAVPRRVIVDAVTPPPPGPAIFSGSVYGERAVLLQHAALDGLLVVQRSPEAGTLYPRLFERLHMMTSSWVERRRPASRAALATYLFLLRRLRRRIFHRWLRSLGRGSAVVSLPHLVRAYPGRVVEAMAVGRPVIACDVADRPRNRALFEDGREIVLFPAGDPAALAEAIRRLRRDPAAAHAIASNAWHTLRRLHTIEHRVRQIFTWTEMGDEPVFS